MEGRGGEGRGGEGRGGEGRGGVGRGGEGWGGEGRGGEGKRDGGNGIAMLSSPVFHIQCNWDIVATLGQLFLAARLTYI